MNNKIIDFIKNNNLIMFLVDFNCSLFLILIENSGNSVTSNKDNIIVTKNNSKENSVLYWLIIIGKDPINIAAARVGSPINEFVCLVSMLNFNKQIDEKTGNKKAI